MFLNEKIRTMKAVSTETTVAEKEPLANRLPIMVHATKQKPITAASPINPIFIISPFCPPIREPAEGVDCVL